VDAESSAAFYDEEHINGSVFVRCAKERGRHIQVRPFLVAACRLHAFAELEPVRVIVSSVPPTPVRTSSTPAGSSNDIVLFLACL